jgi:transposase-like protein
MNYSSCPYCRSAKVIKHGTTSVGNTRFRCRNCGKTWVTERKDAGKPDISDVVEAYLNGRTCRDLVEVYHSSPLRINQKIREFLDGCPPWEEYLDSVVKKHEPRLIYLFGGHAFNIKAEV